MLGLSGMSEYLLDQPVLANYALQARTSEEFVHLLAENLPPAPEYFAREVDLNRRALLACPNSPHWLRFPLATCFTAISPNIRSSLLSLLPV